MLWSPVGDLGFSVANADTTHTEAAYGTAITSHASSANTKNATPTQLIAGASVTQDIYGISIKISGGFLAGESRRFLVDFYVDPAGGTSWESTPRIANLAANSCSFTMGGVNYYFPLFIPAGSAIGAACQAQLAALTCRVRVRLHGKPRDPHLMKVGTKVNTYGASTATTVGTTMSAGASNVKGSWSSSLGSLAGNCWWWQVGMIINDSSQVTNGYHIDVALGDASNKRIAIFDAMHLNVGTGEVAGLTNSAMPPILNGVTGENVYARVATHGTADSSLSAIAYGVGG